MIFIDVAFACNAYTLGNVEWLGVILTLAAFILLRVKKLSPILIIGLSGIVGLGVQLLIAGQEFASFRIAHSSSA